MVAFTWRERNEVKVTVDEVGRNVGVSVDEVGGKKELELPWMKSVGKKERLSRVKVNTVSMNGLVLASS